MALKYFVENLDGIEEGMKALYVKGEKGYTLEVEGVTSKEKVDEFRTTNVRLLKEAEEMKKKFGDVDMTKYQEMLDAIKKAEDAKLSETERLTRDFENKESVFKTTLEEFKSKNETLNSQVETMLIDTKIQDAANLVGKIRQGAMQDVLSRGRNTWHVKDGDLIPHNADGSLKIGEDTKAISLNDWATDLVKTAPYLFEDNSGGGAPGGAGGVVKTVSAGDEAGIISNLEKIASGEVKIV